MLIDCTYCQARVNGEILKLAAYHHPEEWTNDYQITLLRCPECKHLLVGEQGISRPSVTDAGGFTIEDEKWLRPLRVWPEPVTMLRELSIPETIGVCLLEARNACTRRPIPPVSL